MADTTQQTKFRRLGRWACPAQDRMPLSLDVTHSYRIKGGEEQAESVKLYDEHDTGRQY